MKLIQTEDYIRIGNGGGFAGIETTYTIYKNGQLEQAGKVLAKLNPSNVDQLINNISILKLDQIDWNKPGNIYKFIEYNLNGKNHKLTWDSNATDIDGNLNLFYNYVNHLIQKSIQ